jgi:DnaJ family protein C protein 9
MPKSKKTPPSDAATETNRTCLYEILGLDKSASEGEIKKAYRVRALQCHPDKDPSEEAKLNFQKLVAAYNVLKDPESRRLYDESGFIEGEGFDKAAEFFRTKFGRISEQDIVDFEKRYKGSAEEVEDVKQYYLSNKGDISKLLEWIPLSEPEEVDRFLAIVDNLIKKEDLSDNPVFRASITKLRKNAQKMMKERSKFDKENDSSIAELALAIQHRRMKGEEFFDRLISKYAGSDSSKKRRT